MARPRGGESIRPRGAEKGRITRPMSLSIDDVAKVALLARLRLSPDELEMFTGQLNSIVDYVAQLQELDTTDVEPLAHGIEVRNVFRDDVRGPRPAARGGARQRPQAEPGELPGPRRARVSPTRRGLHADTRARLAAGLASRCSHRASEQDAESMNNATATALLAQLNAGAVTLRGGRPRLPRPRRAARSGSTCSSTSTASTSWPRPAPSTPGARPASRSGRWRACRSRSRTCSASRASRRPAAAGCSRTSGPPTTPR